MGLDIASTVNSLGGLMPSGSALMQNILLGAGTSIVLSGLKSQAGLDAIDPLHIIHKDPASGSTTSVAVGSTISPAAFASLPPATQQQLINQGVHIL